MATVPARGQIETLTLNSVGYDKGDVIKITLEGVTYSYTAPAKGPISFNANEFLASGGATLASALTSLNITATPAGNVVTFADGDVGVGATKGAFDLSAVLEEVAATPASVTYSIPELNGTQWTVTVGTATATTPAPTSASQAFSDAAISGLVTSLNSQLADSGVTVSYDASSNSLVVTGKSDGSALPAVAVDKIAWTGQGGTAGTNEVATLTVVDASDGNDVERGNANGNVTGKIVLTNGVIIPIEVAFNINDGKQVEKHIAEAIKAHIEANPSLGITAGTGPNDNVVTLTWNDTGNKADLVATWVPGTTPGDNVTVSISVQQGTAGIAPTLQATPAIALTAGASVAGVEVSNQGAPAESIKQEARDSFLQLQSNALDADMLTGDSGADTFVILHDQNVNMLTTNKFDTITDFDSRDKIDLAFGVSFVAGGEIAGASLSDAVNNLFATGALKGLSQTAGVFDYLGEKFLVVANEAGTSFGNDDIIVKILGVGAALNIDGSDFI
jgi:hypothetical protein